MEPTPRWAAARLITARANRLPEELVDYILDYNYARRQPTAVSIKPSEPAVMKRSPAYTPPAIGCPFMELPTELRRDIFAESLPAKDVMIQPKCNDDKVSESEIAASKRWARRNPTSDLMTLNKKICGEVTEVVYQERTFVVHVHEGLKDGGIEFLNAKRQPLQYQDHIADGRFWKFSEKENDFGFRRLKKIHVQIFPSEEKKCKHSAINTYFMNLALVRLLERDGKGKNDISSLTVEFMQSKKSNDQQGRLAIQQAEQYWWDPDKKQPRESSVHGLPNIELVLRPFANLTTCHRVSVEMPHNLASHPRIAKFVQDLKASMTSRKPFSMMFADDDLEMKIESARWAMEEYVNYTLHGKRHNSLDNLREDEVQEPGPDEMDLDYDGQEGAIPGTKRRPSVKRGLSPASHSTSPGGESKKSKSNEKIVHWQAFDAHSRNQSSEPSPSYYSLEDDEALARALEESQRMADRPPTDDADNRQLQAAIVASMEDEVARKVAEEEAQEVREANGAEAHEMAERRNRWAVQARQQTGNFKFSNGLDVLSTAGDSGGSLFVGQGRTLRDSPNVASPPANEQDHLDHPMVIDDAPWDVEPALKSFYKAKTNINGSAATAPSIPPTRISYAAVAATPTTAHSPSMLGNAKPKVSTGSPPTKEASQMNISGSPNSKPLRTISQILQAPPQVAGCGTTAFAQYDGAAHGPDTAATNGMSTNASTRPSVPGQLPDAQDEGESGREGNTNNAGLNKDKPKSSLDALKARLQKRQADGDDPDTRKS